MLLRLNAFFNLTLFYVPLKLMGNRMRARVRARVRARAEADSLKKQNL